MSSTCKNCNHHFEGNYCNNCGQTKHTHAINFHSIVHEIQHSLLHVDKGILYTTKELFIRPGQTIREYLQGKRVKHFKPIAYILLLSTIYALLSKVSHKSTFLDDFIFGMGEGFSDNDGVSKADNGFVLVLKWMQNHYAYTTLILIPIISLGSYLAFIQSKYNYFEHLILNCYTAGQRTAIFLLLLPFTYFITDKEMNGNIDTSKAYFAIFLTFFVYYQFFQHTSPIKRILLTLLSYIIMIAIFFVVVILAALFTGLFK
jgi:hypothetical protein